MHIYTLPTCIYYIHRNGLRVYSVQTVILHTLPTIAREWVALPTNSNYIHCILRLYYIKSFIHQSTKPNLYYKFKNTINTFTTFQYIRKHARNSSPSHTTHKPGNIAITTAKNQKKKPWLHLFIQLYHCWEMVSRG